MHAASLLHNAGITLSCVYSRTYMQITRICRFSEPLVPSSGPARVAVRHTLALQSASRLQRWTGSDAARLGRGSSSCIASCGQGVEPHMALFSHACCERAAFCQRLHIMQKPLTSLLDFAPRCHQRTHQQRRSFGWQTHHHHRHDATAQVQCSLRGASSAVELRPADPPCGCPDVWQGLQPWRHSGIDSRRTWGHAGPTFQVCPASLAQCAARLTFVHPRTAAELRCQLG